MLSIFTLLTHAVSYNIHYRADGIRSYYTSPEQWKLYCDDDILISDGRNSYVFETNHETCTLEFILPKGMSTRTFLGEWTGMGISINNNIDNLINYDAASLHNTNGYYSCYDHMFCFNYTFSSVYISHQTPPSPPPYMALDLLTYKPTTTIELNTIDSTIEGGFTIKCDNGYNMHGTLFTRETPSNIPENTNCLLKMYVYDNLNERKGWNGIMLSGPGFTNKTYIYNKDTVCYDNGECSSSYAFNYNETIVVTPWIIFPIATFCMFLVVTFFAIMSCKTTNK